jgi:tetratricopeptide (TPR) repeat protein
MRDRRILDTPGVGFLMADPANDLRKLTSPRLAAAVIGAVGFAVYAGTLGYDFVYDDVNQILENPWIWNPRFLLNLFTKAVWSFKDTGPSNYYRPVQVLLYFLDAQIFGRHPFGFHLTNVLVHAFCSAVAFLLLRRVTGERRAALAAVLFAVHPAHVESVAWIAGSTDVDCALPVFSCLLAWSRAHDASVRRPAALVACSGLLFFLALLAKETAVVTPILALGLLPISSRARPQRVNARWREAAWVMMSFGAALALYVPVRLHALGGLHPLVRHAGFTMPQVVANGLALVPRYLVLAFFPWKLMPDRVFVPVASLLDPAAVMGALILAGALAAAVALGRSAPTATFGIGLLVLPLLPALQVQYVGPSAQADRYLYIPSLGACLLLVEALAWVRRRLTGPVTRNVLAAGCVLVSVTAAAWTMTAATMWRNNESLARAGIALEPRSVIMRLILAHVLDEAGRLDEAYGVARQAIDIDPLDHGAAALAADLRIRSEAKTPESQIAMYQKLLAADPGPSYVWTNLSIACVRAGRYQEAKDAAERALESDPNNTEALLSLGTAKGSLGDFAGQQSEALRLLQIDPGFAQGWLNLGVARLGLGALDQAEADLSHAMDLDPKLARAHLYLSLIASRRTNSQEALRQAELASQLDPSDAEIWNHLGVMLARSGDLEGARSAWERALSIDPGNTSALGNLERLKSGPTRARPAIRANE